MRLDDTIAAIATPLMPSGIGVIRISGKKSISLVDKYLAIGTNKDLELINNFDPMDFILNGISYNKKIFHNKTPMELNLWCAIDFKKGCYLGQEIVARMKYLGIDRRKFSTLITKNTYKEDEIPFDDYDVIYCRDPILKNIKELKLKYPNKPVSDRNS